MVSLYKSPLCITQKFQSFPGWWYDDDEEEEEDYYYHYFVCFYAFISIDHYWLMKWNA